MINYNGNFKDLSSDHFGNRGFLFGDSIFETIKVVDNKIIYWEEHYLRLISSMRILRIEIPNLYTPDFFEDEIRKTNLKIEPFFSGRVRLTIFRKGGGLYLPQYNDPIFVIDSQKTDQKLFNVNIQSYKIDLFKEYQIQSNLISNLNVVDSSGAFYLLSNSI